MEPQTAPASQPIDPISPTNVSLPSLPTAWPGAFGIYKYSKAAVKFNLKTILMLTVLSILASTLSSLRTPGKILGELVSLILSVAFIHAYIASVRGEKLDLGQALKRCQPLLVLKYIANTFFLVLALGISFLLLVVPFFFVLPRLLLAPYFLIDLKRGPIAALQSSWDATKGHSGKLWGIIGASIVMVLPVVTIIGIPFAVYFLFMYGAAFALAYDFIIAQAAPVAVPPAAAKPTTKPTPAL